MPGIFLQEGDALVAMRETPYDTEALLQELIAKHPHLLAGEDSEDLGNPWLLVRREAAVYDEEDAASRGSLDHLFIDGDGVPTLVEVKRATDTRIRREVVGQLLDYAANSGHWTVDRLKGWFDARCRADGLTPADVLATHTSDPEELWENVRTNLAAGRLRLVFLADEIPPALRRIIEFLNGQMTECEVIAIEVRQYLGEQDQRIVVPRVLGQTEAARQVKGKRQVRHWDRTSILDDLRSKCDHAAVAAALRILEWGDDRPTLRCIYGHGAVDGSVQFGVMDQERRIFPFVVYTSGAVEIPFARMAEYEPFAADALRDAYRRKLLDIPGVDLPADTTNKRPSISLDILAAPGSLEAFLAAAEWALAQPLSGAQGAAPPQPPSAR
jgi:hypothetical protein